MNYYLLFSVLPLLAVLAALCWLLLKTKKPKSKTTPSIGGGQGEEKVKSSNRHSIGGGQGEE